MKTKHELAHVARLFGRELVEKNKLRPGQVKALNYIMQCRTLSMGGHEEECDCCHKSRYSYNSCGNRNCPKCQATKQALWIEKLIEKTLPVKHYHIIFTLPHCLNKICLYNQRMYYNLMFDAVWQTLRSFGYSEYGAETGAIAMLHTWGQNLWLHPHLHCIVPAVGYSLKGEWVHLDKYKDFLYPVLQLSTTFKGKFLDSLKRKLKKMDMLKTFDPLIQNAYNKKWVVFSEASMAGADHVVRYLGQYTHRVAITNHRILDITNTHVTFISKDYRDKAKKKPVTLKGTDFLTRFCLHILPERLVKVRRMGIYNETTKRNLNLQFFPDEKPVIHGQDNNQPVKPKVPETTQERLKRLTGFDVYQCPFCLKGNMHKTAIIPRIRSPARSRLSVFFSLVH